LIYKEANNFRGTLADLEYITKAYKQNIKLIEKGDCEVDLKIGIDITSPYFVGLSETASLEKELTYEFENRFFYCIKANLSYMLTAKDEWTYETLEEYSIAIQQYLKSDLYYLDKYLKTPAYIQEEYLYVGHPALISFNPSIIIGDSKYIYTLEELEKMGVSWKSVFPDQKKIAVQTNIQDYYFIQNDPNLLWGKDYPELRLISEYFHINAQIFFYDSFAIQGEDYKINAQILFKDYYLYYHLPIESLPQPFYDENLIIGRGILDESFFIAIKVFFQDKVQYSGFIPLESVGKFDENKRIGDTIPQDSLQITIWEEVTPQDILKEGEKAIYIERFLDAQTAIIAEDIGESQSVLTLEELDNIRLIRLVRKMEV